MGKNIKKLFFFFRKTISILNHIFVLLIFSLILTLFIITFLTSQSYLFPSPLIDVDSIIDFKAEEKVLKDKVKKKLKQSRKSKGTKKKEALGFGKYQEIKEVESSENS